MNRLSLFHRVQCSYAHSMIHFLRPALVLNSVAMLCLVGLAACADTTEPNHIYHPHSHHHGKSFPQWYQPPTTPNNQGGA